MRVAGLALVLTAVDAAVGAPAAAVTTVVPHAGKARSKVQKKTTRKTSAKARTRRSRRATVRRAEGRAEGMAPAAADLTTFAVPSVVLPEAIVVRDSSTGKMVMARGTFAAITRSATSLLDGLVARARSQLGTRYVYGGDEPGAGLDCSSFAQYVMQALDIRLPRTAHQQARVGVPVPRDPSQLRPGDLLTFGSKRFTSHVGIYLGEGRFIHASVKSGRVIETTIDRNRSLFRRWQGARRVLADGAAVADVPGSGG